MVNPGPSRYTAHFLPNSPVEIVAVKAERHEVIIYDGADVETLLLVYRMDAGSGIRAAREPVAREWVDPERTNPALGNIGLGLRLRFERMPPDPADPRTSLLNLQQSRNLGWPLGQWCGS